MSTRKPNSNYYLVSFWAASFLRSRKHLIPRHGRTEKGYSLVVALVAGFVLLIGVGALASRGNLGFIGQVYQTQNRQARDVAESAIAEFGNTMNQERNRNLLVAGTTANWVSSTWSTSQERDLRNVCTVFDDNFTPNLNSGNPVFVDPDPAAVARFSPGGAPQNLIAGDNSRTFVVESVEFLNQLRQPYVDGSGDFLSFENDPGPPLRLSHMELGINQVLKEIWCGLLSVGRLPRMDAQAPLVLHGSLKLCQSAAKDLLGVMLLAGVFGGEMKSSVEQR